MTETRERYEFDFDPVLDGVKYFNLFAVGVIPSERTMPGPNLPLYYAEGGANNGLRVLVTRKGRDWYAGFGLHARTLVRAADEEKLRRLLSRAADDCPAEKLISLEEIGFQKREGERVYRHPDGWFTRSNHTLLRPAPSWAPEAEAWDLVEGIYLRFPDETSRLVWKRAYYSGEFISLPGPPVFRQGDLLIYEEVDNPNVALVDDKLHHRDEADGQLKPVDKIEFDRHTVELHPDPAIGGIIIRHPEHEPIALGVIERANILLAPGTSRPFQRRGGLD